MKTTFIITSAVMTNLGVYDLDTRILQSLRTVESIRNNFADANIILVEGGDPRINQTNHPLWIALKQSCSAYLDLTQNDQIEFIHSNINPHVKNKREMGGLSGVIKSISEMTIFYQTLLALRDAPELAEMREVDRVFKISGRYELSPLFDKNMYPNDDSYTFKQSVASWIPDAIKQVGTDRFYSSRLWSFCPTRLNATIEHFENMINDAHTLNEANKYIDIEHLLFKHIGPEHAVELDWTHLMGTIAPNGTMIYD